MPDSLRAVLDSVFAQAAYDWRPRPDPFAVVRRVRDALVRWLVDLREAYPAAFDVVFWMAVLAVSALVVRAGWVVSRGFRAVPGPSGGGAAAPVKDARWYRAHAEACHRGGRLVEAMQADFTALMLELDARRVVRFHPSKTPQEYVREAALPEAARGELRDLVWSLYRHLFAREPVTPEDAAAWRGRTARDRYAFLA